MIYSLRKLIAFVFLLGMFWYIYTDPANLDRTEFMASLGGLAAIFAAFYFVVPLLVVRMRIMKRNRQNRAGYEKWRARADSMPPAPMHRNRKLNIDKNETAYFHEKGTFYVESGAGFDAMSVPGRIGDVAFPKEHRDWRKAQRVHCYFTSRRVLFLGKEIDCDLAYASIPGFRTAPGGIVFEVDRGYCVAFTFQNPLIAAEVLGWLKKESK